MKTKNCPNCGAPRKPHDTRCEYCGTPFTNSGEINMVYGSPSYRQFSASVRVPEDMIRNLGDKKVRELVKEEMATDIAKQLIPYIYIQEEFNFDDIVSSMYRTYVGTMEL